MYKEIKTYIDPTMTLNRSRDLALINIKRELSNKIIDNDIL